MSHRGGGGEALTHPFSMLQPSLPGPGRLRPFSREVLEEKSGIQHPSLPSPSPKEAGSQMKLSFTQHLYSVLGGRDGLLSHVPAPFCLRALCPLLRGGPGAQRPGLEEKQGSWSLPVSAALLLFREEGMGAGALLPRSQSSIMSPAGDGVVGVGVSPASAAGEPQGSDSQGSAREAAQSKGFWKRK